MIKPKCVKCETRNCFINKYVNKDWKNRIDSQRMAFHFKKGDTVFLEGAPVSGIYFIYKGKVKVYKTGTKNRTQIVRLANSGNILGHRGFGKENTYPIGAKALETATICYISKELFIDAMNHNGNLATELVNFYADELRRAENKLLSLSQMTVRQKLAEVFLTLSEIYGQTNENGNDFLNIKLSRQEYADITGTSIEEVIRTISQLNKEKIIHIEGKKIAVISKEKLHTIIKEYGILRLP